MNEPATHLRITKIFDSYYFVDCSLEAKDAIFKRIIKYMEETHCTSGECLQQSDKCIIEAPSVLSDIIDDILKPEPLKKEI